jgi:hypothetical protein
MSPDDLESHLTPEDLENLPGAFEFIDTESADDFLLALRTVALRKQKEHVGRPPLRWAFRGQASADWRLTPSALRDGAKLGYESGDFYKVNKVNPNAELQMIAEFSAVRQFLLECDEAGLPVPGDSQAARSMAFVRRTVLEALSRHEWPPPPLLDLFAFAQHHRVPTRLLDFTACYQRAAYFAASSVAERPTVEGRLAVWALDLDFLQVASRFYNKSGLVRVTAPSATNTFLRAQRGFFLCAERSESIHLDDVLSRMAAVGHAMAKRFGWGGIDHSWRAGVKVTCPADAYEPILDILEALGVHKASIYPTYAHVVERLEGRRTILEDLGAVTTSGQIDPKDIMSPEMAEWLDAHGDGDPFSV